MEHYEFKDDEVDLMREILEGYLHELSSEISGTDTLSFRQELKAKKGHVIDLLDRFRPKAA